MRIEVAPKMNDAQIAVQNAFCTDVQMMYATAVGNAAGQNPPDIAGAVAKFSAGLKLAREIRDALVAAAATPTQPKT